MDDIIYLEPLSHREQSCIAVVGRLGSAAYNVLKAFPGRSYSKTHGCWYIVFEPDALLQLAERLGACQRVEISERFPKGKGSTEKVGEMIALPDGYHECLVRVRYSEATVKTYESQLRLFLGWLRPRTLNDLTDAIINDYQLYLASVRKVSISTQNTAINAIKFYLEKVHHGERKVYYVDRPMKETKLPHVLTQEEVKALLKAAKNMKHCCILLVLYSTGIRMSELLNLRWTDFDDSKLQLFVRGGKGFSKSS